LPENGSLVRDLHRVSIDEINGESGASETADAVQAIVAAETIGERSGTVGWARTTDLLFHRQAL
jgi:hypothetical protein